jgi:hypothetical protein
MHTNVAVFFYENFQPFALINRAAASVASGVPIRF